MIEDLARESASDLTAGTTGDAAAGLADLYTRQARHRRRTRLGAVAAVAVAAVVGWGGGVALTRTDSQGPEPGVVHRPSPSVAAQVGVCTAPLVHCLGGRTYAFGLASPVVWHIPRGFGVDSGAGASSGVVESYWNHRRHGGGVSVLEHVRAAAEEAGPAPAAGVAPTAYAFTHWLATRPYLVASSPRRTTLDGHAAWTVRVAVRHPGVAGPGICSSRYACHPLTYGSHRVTGMWSDMVADYTAFDAGGHGSTVVWSWSFGHDLAALATNRTLVAGLSFPGS